MWWRRLRYLLLLVVLCSIATCPMARRSCTAKVRSEEAPQLLEYLADRVDATVRTTGKVPPLAAGPTPQPNCCELGGVCGPDVTRWATPGWQALQFTIDGDSRYTYSYTPAVDGQSAVLRAVGDLDCDTVYGTFELTMKIVPNTPVPTLRTWTKTQPYQ